MFTLTVLPDGSVYQYTIVRPDASTRSGGRTKLMHVLDIFHDEVKGWEVRQKARATKEVTP